MFILDSLVCVVYLFFNDTSTTEIYTYGHTLSLHDALPISRRHGDFDLVVDTAADRRAAERRIIADLAILRVGFGLADDLVTDGLVVLVGERDGRAEHDAVARQRRRIDHLRARKLVLQVADRRFDLALTFLRGVIFGIFRKVATIGRAHV